MILTEQNLLNFNEEIKSMDSSLVEDYAIDLINFLEDSNMNIEDYRGLHFYSACLGLLTENNKLTAEHRNASLLLENTTIEEDIEEDIILTEAASTPLTKREKITKRVLDILKTLDISGLNVEKYKKLYNGMTDEQFEKYIKNFIKDPEANFYMEILPNKNEPTIYQIEKALEKLKVPKDEYVYYRHDGCKANPIRTRERVPVGFITVRRLQQTLAKKNTYSLDIDNRNLKTGQVQAADKIARISDSELYALTIFGADNAIKEFFSSRADNQVSKRDLYSKISKYGYAYLDELENDISGNQTLNTINTFLLGAGIDSDMVTSKETTAKDALRKIVVDETKETLKENYQVFDESTVTTDRPYVYIGLTEADIKLGRVKYDPTEKTNGKYVNFTLEGLESFIAEQRITKEIVGYTKVSVDDVDVALFEEESLGAIIKLPVDIPILEHRKLDIRIEEEI